MTKKEADEHGISTCDSTNIAENGIDGKLVTFHLVPVVRKIMVRRIIKNLENINKRAQHSIKNENMTFSDHAKELIQTEHESGQTANKEIEPVTTSSCYPLIKELKEKLREMVNFKTNNDNAEMSAFDKLSTQPQDNEHFRNISTMIKYFQKCTDDYF